MTDNDKILQRDDKLLQREKSWRRARVGIGILSVIWFLMLVSFFNAATSEIGTGLEQKELLPFFIVWVLFWFLLFDWLNMRIRHIESIKYYREKIEKAECDNRK